MELVACQDTPWGQDPTESVAGCLASVGWDSAGASFNRVRYETHCQPSLAFYKWNALASFGTTYKRLDIFIAFDVLLLLASQAVESLRCLYRQRQIYPS